MSGWRGIAAVALLVAVGVGGAFIRGFARAALADRRRSRPSREVRERVLLLTLHEFRGLGYPRGKVFHGFDGPEVVVGFDGDEREFASALLTDRPSRAARRLVREHGFGAALDRGQA